jgi:hypothetical protein
VAVQQIATDAFGNALGESIGQAISPPNTYAQAARAMGRTVAQQQDYEDALRDGAGAAFASPSAIAPDGTYLRADGTRMRSSVTTRDAAADASSTWSVDRVEGRYGIDPKQTTAWMGALPGTTPQALAVQRLEQGGTLNWYSDGYVIDNGGTNVSFTAAAMPSNTVLRPGGLDGIMGRASYLRANDAGSDEYAQLAGYLGDTTAALAQGNREVAAALLQSEANAPFATNASVQRMRYLGMIADPGNPELYRPDMGQVLGEGESFAMKLGAGGFGANMGLRFFGTRLAAIEGTALRFGVTGAVAGATGEVGVQAIDNAWGGLSGGRFGEVGVDVTRLAIATAGGAALGGLAGFGLERIRTAVARVREMAWFGKAGEVGSTGTADAMHSATASGSEVFHGPGMTRLGSDGASVRVSQNVAPLDGYHDVVVHGGAYDDTGAIFYVEGQPTHAGQVATAILENPSYTPGQPVRLITCWGGCGPAQEVSDILQVPVKGATNIVAVPNKPLSLPFVMNGGTWLDFTPH